MNDKLLLRLELSSCKRKKEEQESQNNPSHTMMDLFFEAFAAAYVYDQCLAASRIHSPLPCVLGCRIYAPKGECFAQPMQLKSAGNVLAGEDIMDCIDEEIDLSAQLEECKQAIGESE